MYNKDKNGTYRYDINSQQEEKINDYYALSISVNQDDIFFTDKNRMLYHYNLKTNLCEEFYSDWTVSFGCISGTNKVYIQIFKDKQLIEKVIEY